MATDSVDPAGVRGNTPGPRDQLEHQCSTPDRPLTCCVQHVGQPANTVFNVSIARAVSRRFAVTAATRGRVSAYCGRGLQIYPLLACVFFLNFGC